MSCGWCEWKSGKKERKHRVWVVHQQTTAKIKSTIKSCTYVSWHLIVFQELPFHFRYLKVPWFFPRHFPSVEMKKQRGRKGVFGEPRVTKVNIQHALHITYHNNGIQRSSSSSRRWRFFCFCRLCRKESWAGRHYSWLQRSFLDCRCRSKRFSRHLWNQRRHIECNIVVSLNEIARTRVTKVMMI